MKPSLLRLFTLSLASLLPQAGLAEEWHSLFDGESLAGWQANENAATWSVVDGAIVARGERSHLFYVGEVADGVFRNFEFSAEVMTRPGSNSGIYVHTKYQDAGWPEEGYELQVINSSPPTRNPLAYVERKMTGSIYAIRNAWSSPVPDDQWFEYRIVVSGKTLQTYIDGALVCEYTEPESPWRPDDKKQRLLGSGTFALQGHDPDSEVHFRNLRARLLPDDAPSLGEPLEDAELDRLITGFSNSNHPLIDLGIGEAGTEPSPEQLAAARRYGFTLARLELRDAPYALLVVNDREHPARPELLRIAAHSGAKLGFSSGGAGQLEEQRVRARLKALEESGVDWRLLWTPGM